MAPVEGHDAPPHEAAASGVLLVVATPIGNLGDITLRAIEALKAVDRVVAEDTRRTRALLSHLGIAGKAVDRLDAHAGAADIDRVVAHLRDGERVALVTDAGTPVVSDPGTALVAAAVAAGVRVEPIPGACAAVAALSVSGLITGAFRFLGFLPRSGPERREAIAIIVATPEPVVLYESPQRIAETLADLARPMPARAVVVAREITKVHEEMVRGTLADLAALDRTWLGEITLVLGPAPAVAAEGVSDEEIDRRIDEGLARGRRAKDLAEEIALETSRPRRDVYARIVARRR
ncbi:rRNA small subunit methyltransferase I [Minicystis rosea]|nr:rRNA small subunit methyltransferase I [Minicystis rosea]